MSTPAIRNPNTTTTPRVFPRTPETHQRAGATNPCRAVSRFQRRRTTMRASDPIDRALNYFFELRIQEGA